MGNKKMAGHLAALLTITIWGTTFISTKVLLTHLRPIEILLVRFAVGYLALLAACPRRLRTGDRRQELTLAAAGLCGVCLYYLLENIALTYTLASNVGVIISVAPFFTALLARRGAGAEERPRAGFWVGFAAAMAGIALISFNGSGLELAPVGDLLAVAAALAWACYSLLTKRIGHFGYPVLLTTRRIFFYGLLFMLPALPVLGFRPGLFRSMDTTCLVNLLYLGLGASALCFVTWNFAVKELGAVKTSVYIYLVPVVTVATSALVLGERLTPLSGVGTGLTLAGLLLSEYRPRGRGEHGPSE